MAEFLSNPVTDSLSRSISSPQRQSPPRPARPDPLFLQPETNKPLPMIPQNRHSITESQIHAYIPRPLHVVNKSHESHHMTNMQSLPTPDEDNPRLLSKDHAGRRSARASLSPSELREHLKEATYDPKSLSTGHSSSPEVLDIERILSPRTRVTGLRRRNTSSVYYLRSRHERSTSNSTIQTNTSVGRQRSHPSSFSTPPRRRTTSINVESSSCMTPVSSEEPMQKFSSRNSSARETDRTSRSQGETSSTPAPPKGTVYPLPRKPVPFRSRNFSSPVPSSNHCTSHFETLQPSNTLSYVDPASNPSRPEIPSMMSTGSSYYRVSDTEPRSGWDSDDSCEDQKTLMGRVKSSLQLPAKSFTFGASSSAANCPTSDEKPCVTSTKVSAAVEKRRTRGNSLSNKVTRMGRIMLCGC